MTWPVPPGSYSSAPYYQHYYGSYREYPPDPVTMAHQTSTPQEGDNHELAGFQQETHPENAEMTYTYTLEIISPKRKSEFQKVGAFKTPI
jgi:hypothetical protein